MYRTDPRAAEILVSDRNTNTRTSATGCICFDFVCLLLLLLFRQMAPVSAPVPAPVHRAPVQVEGSSVVPIKAAAKAVPPHVLQGAIPSGHIPRPVIVPDYIG